MDAVRDLCRFIDASPCPAHAADTIVHDLERAGYLRLDAAGADWDLAPGGRYLVQRGAAVIAFAVRSRAVRRYRLVGAHTDSPHLRLRARPAFAAEGCRQLAVEVYGGALLNSWLDRDLGLAGTVWAADGSARSIRLHRPLARVAQLAIHLDRRVNEDGLKLNPQLHLAPLWGLGADAEQAFAELVAKAAGLAPGDVAGHDLSLYDLQPAAVGGGADEFLFAGRLDNLASCHAAVRALVDVEGDAATLPLIACFDHEEVGSGSDAGAGGALLGTVLERIALALGLSRTQHLAALAGSLLLSADMAHAVHPNFPDRHEPRHKPRLGGGPVIKANVNQRYATTGATAAHVRALAKRADLPLQDFAARGDIGCGSTIGPLAAAQLGIAVADVGTPMLSMHSARECAATADHPAYVALLTEHLKG